MFERKNGWQTAEVRRPVLWRQLLTRNVTLAASISILVLISVCVVFAAVSLSTSTPYTQNFDGIGTAGVASLPADWKVDKQPTAIRTLGNYAFATTVTNFVSGPNLSPTATNGIYNFGSGTDTSGPDRAVGFLSSGTGTVSGNLYTQLFNNTGGTLTGLQISYDVEKYRNGTNPAGFRIQMFFSINGSTWASAGPNFLTTFAADANNNGFSTAPGAAVSVNSKTLNVSVANGANIYLAWNYSVSSGSTATNAQALAIDNVSILGLSAGGSTNPSGTGAASPSSVAPTGSTLLTVSVTPGTIPVSTGLTVSGNLSAIGESSTQLFFDDQTHGDVTAGDNVFSYTATVANGTSGGVKSLPFTITDAQARSGSGSISLTVLASTNPSGTGAATPSSVLPGDPSTLTVMVTPGTNPTSSGIAVTADLSSIGGVGTQQFFNDGTNGDATSGDNIFTYATTIPIGTSTGSKNLPFSIGDAQARFGSGSITLTIQSPPPPADHVVISQLYGGGGNSGASFTNDFIELYNPTGVSFNITGWSVQYGSATGTSWTNNQSLVGSIGPGEYYLVSLASGGSVGSPLPVMPNISGDINMSATAGKVALVNNSTPLSGSCPLGADPDIVDFVGYGTTANCSEGLAKASAPSNSTALFRKANGAQDTNQNGADFVIATPSPRRTAPIAEVGPSVTATDPTTNDTNTPHDSSITINFSEPVDVVGAWYNINCANTGLHNDATVASSSGSKTYVITPNTNFQFGEQCTVTINKDGVHDQDLDDSDPNTDTLSADYSWSFTVVLEGTTPYPSSVHLTMGNPSNALADLTQPDNYLMEKPSFALSYNRDKGSPNWVSWHLDSLWTGNLTRNDTFRPDPAVPPEWYRVQATDFFTTGFDRGHMTPNADRNNAGSIPLNQETFLMSNMVAQAPGNNQGPWADLESFLRTLLNTNEIYVVSGPAGIGGVGSNSPSTTTMTVANGHVTVPSSTWKVALVIPKGEDDISRVTAASRTIAVIMPNQDSIRGHDWHEYLTTVDAVEQLTGYDFFSNVPDAVENSIEAGLDGSNPPGTESQFVTTAEDTAKSITLTAVSPVPSASFTYAIVGSPTHGILTGSGADLSYAPDPEYHGPDSFTFSANDGARNSNISTIDITVTEVNDPPVANNDTASTDEDMTLNLSSADLTTNDNAGPADESLQTLTVTQVTATMDTHGTVMLANGIISYSPAQDYNGPASFTYQVCDDGTTSGAPDSKCVTATVDLTVKAVNDNPAAVDDSATTDEDMQVSIDVLANDTDVDGDVRTLQSVGTAAHGSVSIAGGQALYSPAANFNGTDSFTYVVSDGHGGTASGTVTVSINAVNDNPVAIDDSATTDEDTPVSINVVANDTDVDGDPRSLQSVGSAAHGSVSLAGGQAFYSPAPNFNGTDSFTYVVSDGQGGTATGNVSVTVNPVNDAPVLTKVPTGATVDELSLYTFTAGASDIDVPAQICTFSLVGAPTGASIDPSTGVFTWTPTEAQGGTGVPYVFTVRVSDGVTNTDAGISLTVREVNQAPTLNSIGNKTVYLGNTLSFTASGFDGDVPVQTLTFSFVGAIPAGASIDSTSGAFSWTPTADQVGQTYTFKVRITDNGSPNLFTEEQISVGVGVAYTWSGLLAPVQPNGVYKAERTIPLKFFLTGPSAGISNAVAKLFVFKVSNDVLGDAVDIESTSAATTGNLFRYSGGQYIFNWNTSGLAAGTYQLQIDLGDGVTRAVNISLR